MAGQIYGFNQVFDANGVPLPGALFHTYVPGTTTPKATYTTEALNVANPNPVVADSAGRFPQMFGETDTLYDGVLTDADGATIESYYDLAALGGTGDNINLDFGANGRLQIVGANGEPNIEFGDPTGDDIGGDGRIGGWNDTQGDNLEVDFATTTFTGAIRNTDFAEPFPRLLVSGTTTASTQLDIPLNSAFSMWELQLRNLKTSTGGAPQMRLSFDNGVSFKSGASDYVSQGFYYDNVGVTNFGTATATQISLTASGLNTVNGGATLVVKITSQAGQETRTLSTYQTISDPLSSSRGGQHGGTTNNTNYGRATNIRLIVSAGTMTYDYRLIGIP